MGSARVSNAKPIPMENTDKKSLKTLIKSLFHKKKEKPKIEKKENEEKKETKQTQIQKPNTVAAILENFNKLNLEEEKPTAAIKQDSIDNEEDELDNFAFKVIEEPRNERIYSHSSEDSGFSDTKNEENSERNDSEDTDNVEKTKQDEESEENSELPDDLAEELEKLDLSDDKKKKKLQTIVVARKPVKNKVSSFVPAVCPYPTQEQDSYRQISQINKHTLTGGQVLVNHCTAPDNFSEVKIALESVQKNSQFLQNDSETYFQDVMELIHEDTNSNTNKPIPKLTVTNEFNVEKKSLQYMTEYEKTIQQNDLMELLQGNYDVSPEMTNSIEEFAQEEITQIFNYVQKEYNASNDSFVGAQYTYPTPPRSETVPSPMTASPSSFYPSNSEYTLSPERSPIYNSDFEKYQEIPPFDDEKEATDKKARERTASICSMTMKQFKDMQKEIVNNFSKRDCCQMIRKSCHELFKEHMQKISPGVRQNLCLNISKINLKEAYGVLQHILLNLSGESDKEDIQYTMFALLCERILAQDPALFIGDGLNLLKSASLRCPQRPLLTRFLVQCVRTALTTDACASACSSQEHIFHEVDALGDNLVTACARAGDRCSDVLSELLRAHEGQPPLFRHNHTNADGYTALHVACSQHSAANPRLHTVHVLLVHADFKITDGDLKGGDTALHLAVNSANCDLQLILMMFKHIDRKDWKSLAHHHNLSNKTPLDLARLASKSRSRHTYPQEVLDFLKKCR